MISISSDDWGVTASPPLSFSSRVMAGPIFVPASSATSAALVLPSHIVSSSPAASSLAFSSVASSCRSSTSAVDPSLSMVTAVPSFSTNSTSSPSPSSSRCLIPSSKLSFDTLQLLAFPLLFTTAFCPPSSFPLHCSQTAAAATFFANLADGGVRPSFASSTSARPPDGSSSTRDSPPPSPSRTHGDDDYSPSAAACLGR
mmetsp:Transcript_7569/g.18780  ORF Transcript_7569/g.18780 Transcript_7569/m.18780 type:complete len:200 (+) Transcript_7569:392-991(+)